MLRSWSISVPTDDLQLSDEWADAQIDVPGAGDLPATKGCLNSFALLKRKYSRLRVVLSVGGGGKGSEPFAAVAANPASRERFAQTALGLVQHFGIDGIDSKWLTTPLSSWLVC
jgi:chitinase